MDGIINYKTYVLGGRGVNYPIAYKLLQKMSFMSIPILHSVTTHIFLPFFSSFPFGLN